MTHSLKQRFYYHYNIVLFNIDWIYVRWDNGTHNAYRYNEEDGKMDVEETSHHPVLLPLDSRTLDFGVKVVRGTFYLS